MADPGKDKKRTKIKTEHGKLIFGQNITSYPSLLLLQTRPTHTNKHKVTGCAEEWPIPVKTRKEQR